MKQRIKLNKYTYRRIFSNATYLENKVNHIFRMYVGHEKYIIDKLNYHFELTDCEEHIMTQLHDLWFITYEGESEIQFSYRRKKDIEEKFHYIHSSDTLPNNKAWLKTIQIELTDACNERCVHCYLPNKKKNSAKSLSLNQVKDILTQFRKMNGLKVIFSGGEILLHRNLKEILNYCKEIGLMIFLQTNLLVLRKEYIEFFKSLELFNIQVSLYSTTAYEHDNITTIKGSWERTKQNIELLVKNDIPVMISCPIMKQNHKSVKAIKEYADSLGIDCYFDAIMMAQTGGSTTNLDYRVPESESNELLRALIETRPDYMNAIKSSKSIDELLSKRFARRMSTCKIMDSGVCVDSDGTIYPCPGWNQMSLGQIDEYSLKYIWEDSEKTKFLRALVPSKFVKCIDCDLKNFCEMCPVYNYNENGTIEQPVPIFCERANKLKSIVIDIYKELKNK